MQILLKNLQNSLYGEKIRKDIEEKFVSKSESWMMSKYDKKVKDYRKLGYENYIVETVDDAGLEDKIKKLKTLPLHLGAFVLSNS